MFETIYIEDGAQGHPRARAALARFPSAAVISCERYGEVFNRSGQDFRAQKQKPALIIALKHGERVLRAPAGYGIGGANNYYFSHLLNCLYDCRYCFLQGMMRSANFVWFVNYDDFGADIKRVSESSPLETYFFSGYDCDSLALDGITHFSKFALELFRDLPKAWLEIRTKSVNVSHLMTAKPFDRAIIAFSMTPQDLSEATEHGVPPLASRIKAMTKLASRGWPIGLRLDPLIYSPTFKSQYSELIDKIFKDIPADLFHSVSMGPLRFPKTMFKTISKMYPTERLLAGPLTKRSTMVSYPQDLETSMMRDCAALVAERVPRARIFHCLPEEL